MSVTARALGPMPDDIRTLCNFAVTLHYDGAAATVVFDECGAPGFPRERLSVFAHGQVADPGRLRQADRVRTTAGRARAPACTSPWATPRSSSSSSAPCKGKPNHLLSWEDASLATTCMFAAQESIRLGAEIDIEQFRQSLLDPAPEGEEAGAEANGSAPDPALDDDQMVGQR